MLSVSVKYWHVYLSSLQVLVLGNISQFHQGKWSCIHLQTGNESNHHWLWSSASNELKSNENHSYEGKIFSEELNPQILVQES